MDQFAYDKVVEPKGKPKKIKVFDTTLRDGEQTPGVNFTVEDKMKIAQALSDLGVDYIEAGFPVSSEGEFQAVKEISGMDIKSDVVGLARCVEADIDAAVDADVDIIHIFIGTSPTHRKYKLNMSKEQVMAKARDSIQYAKDRGYCVHFSPEDACRTEKDYLMKVCKMASDMGVKHINIPDTVGVMTPQAMGWIISEIKGWVKVPLAVHCHNDFGMAAANTMSAVVFGATIPHVTVNGVGERAGNADLEQVVVGCKLIHGIGSNIVHKRIWETSRLVERLSGIKVMPNFPIVGANAFAHKSGVHVHGVLKNASVYEPIKPEYVGTKRRIVLGKLVGTAAVKQKLKDAKIEVTEPQAREITAKIKDLADKGKKVMEDDLIAIAEDMLGKGDRKRVVELKDMSLHSELGKKPTAKVAVIVRGYEKHAKETGVGPVDATLNAIRAAVGDKDIQLDEYHLDAITGGSNALADVSIRVSKNGSSTMARGIHEDVVMASVLAFINGINRLMR
jgi:2-isopropylmalate synthase